MADFTRHGDGQHFMRPDRVYRVGVLAPMMGYDPHRDMQHVAMAFTQGPQRGMMLEGLGAMPGPIRRWWEGVKARIAERKARKFMQVYLPPVDLPPPQGPPGRLPPELSGMPGPAPAMAQQISPHLATQMSGMMELMHSRYGHGFPAAAAAATVQRPLRQWYR